MQLTKKCIEKECTFFAAPPIINFDFKTFCSIVATSTGGPSLVHVRGYEFVTNNGESGNGNKWIKTFVLIKKPAGA